MIRCSRGIIKLGSRNSKRDQPVNAIYNIVIEQPWKRLFSHRIVIAKMLAKVPIEAQSIDYKGVIGPVSSPSTESRRRQILNGRFKQRLQVNGILS